VSEMPPPTNMAPIHVWMAISSETSTGFISPRGAVGFKLGLGGAPLSCRG
jgi:hypothetical protein